MAIPFKTYQCHCWPQYRIRDLVFVDGILEVYTQKEANLIENADGYGVQIFEIHPDAVVEPVQTEVAHQGTKSTAVGEIAEPEAPDDEIVVIGGGFYEYKGQRFRGKKNLPPEAQGLL